MKMGYKCCVPDCRGNYGRNDKVTVFSFPKNEVGRRRWIEAINRDFAPTIHSRVCIQHFTENQIRRTAEGCDEKGRLLVVRLQKPQLRVGAVPCIFKNNTDQSNHVTTQKKGWTRKKKLKNREITKKDNKKLAINSIELSNNVMVSPECNEMLNELKTFHDLIKCLADHKFNDWHVIQKDNLVLFAMISLSDVPTISASATVDTNLEVRIFKGKSEIKTLNGKEFPLKISNINEFEIILNDLSSKSLVCVKKVINENVNALSVLLQEIVQHDNNLHSEMSFLCEQINLLLDKKHHKYSTDYMIFSCILWLISPYAYQYLQKAHLFVLPHISTLCKLCPKYDLSENLENLSLESLVYIRQKAHDLQPKDLVVSLAIDEIRLRPYFSKMDTDVLEKALYKTNGAKIAQVYMIKSLNSSFKEVVHVQSVKEVDSDMLFLLIKKLIIGLHEIGFNVVCVVSNNSLINKGAMSNFVSPPTTQIVYKHPVNVNKPLFYIFDSARILKNIRNDWINQSDELLLFPKFDTSYDKISVADFSEIKKLCEIESSKCITKLKSLNHVQLRRRNIQSVLNIFNKSVIEALQQYGEIYDYPHFVTTAGFIEIILKWWTIMNAKVFSENVCEDYKFLEECLVWLDRWASFELVENKFSDETHEAFTHTIYSFLQLAEYCRSELNFGYILPSKIQTDLLEARYGKFRTMSIYDTPVGSR